MIRTIAAVGLLLAGGCVAPPPDSRLLDECDRYVTSLSVAADMRGRGELTDDEQAHVQGMIPSAERICKQAKPDPAEVPVMVEINAAMTSILAN